MFGETLRLYKSYDNGYNLLTELWNCINITYLYQYINFQVYYDAVLKDTIIIATII